MRHVTAEGLEHIKRHEGLRLSVYLDVAGKPTIGYGHLIQSPETTTQYQGGITEAYAETLLRRDLQKAERAVLRLIKVPLSDPQFDALVSWTFNLGAGALQRSTMRRKLNRGDYAAIPREMLRWVFAGGRKHKGLLHRRQEEGSRFAFGTALLQQEPPQSSAQRIKAIPIDKPSHRRQTSWVARFYSTIKMGMQQAQNSRQTASP